MKDKIQRHRLSDIILHWFNAVCWFALLITGLGLLGNHRINPIGVWLPELLEYLFGDQGTLLLVHEIMGLVWIVGFFIYLMFNFRGTLNFLREIFSISPRRDLEWLLKKPLQLTMGNRAMRKLGIGTELPPQGFYNAGQKAFAQPAVILGILVAVTGIIMFLSDKILSLEHTVLVVWSIGIHFVATGLITAGLAIHIFMAAINLEERPAFYSMFSGYVPADHVKEHNPLWYREIVKNEQSMQDRDNHEKNGMSVP